MTCFLHYVWCDILAKPIVEWRSLLRFPSKIVLVHARTTQYYEKLVLVLESKALYCVIWFSVLTLEKYNKNTLRTEEG